MEEYRIFGFPIRTYILDYFEKNSPDDLIEILKNEKIVHEESHTKTGFWSKSQELFKELELNELEDEILQCVNDYSNKESHVVEGISIVSSWFNVLESNQYIEPHVHLNSYISGTIHLSEGSNLFFRKPPTEDVFQICCELSEYDKHFVEYDVQPGTLVLFPSKLSHGVYPHNREDPRVSIAFNTWPKKFGGTTRFVNLKD